MAAVEWMVNLFYAYAAVGLAFGIAFVTLGIERFDPVSKGSGVAFRLIVLPGAVALWPILLTGWITRK